MTETITLTGAIACEVEGAIRRSFYGINSDNAYNARHVVYRVIAGALAARGINWDAIQILDAKDTRPQHSRSPYIIDVTYKVDLAE